MLLLIDHIWVFSEFTARQQNWAIQKYYRCYNCFLKRLYSKKINKGVHNDNSLFNVLTIVCLLLYINSLSPLSIFIHYFLFHSETYIFGCVFLNFDWPAKQIQQGN